MAWRRFSLRRQSVMLALLHDDKLADEIDILLQPFLQALMASIKAGRALSFIGPLVTNNEARKWPYHQNQRPARR